MNAALLNSNNLNGEKRTWQQVKIKFKNIAQNGKYSYRLYKYLNIISLMPELSNFRMFINSHHARKWVVKSSLSRRVSVTGTLV